MERAFDADFGAVRVDTGEAVGSVARSVRAQAFTVARDVHYRNGLPDLGAEHSRRLLAHELAHTLPGDPGRIGRFFDGHADPAATAQPGADLPHGQPGESDVGWTTPRAAAPTPTPIR